MHILWWGYCQTRKSQCSIDTRKCLGSKWNQLDTKLNVYKPMWLPTLLYACETWTVYLRHAKRHIHLHLCCPRKLLKLRCQDKIPDTEVQTRMGPGDAKSCHKNAWWAATNRKYSVKNFRWENPPKDQWKAVLHLWYALMHFIQCRALIGKCFIVLII